MSETTEQQAARYAPCRHTSPHVTHHEWSSVEEFVRAGHAVPDGVHTVRLPAGPHLDVLLRGRPLDPAHGTACVFFTGAVSGRAEKTAPFFSGAGVTKAVDVPLISVADPGLTLGSTVGLAWYLGGEGAPAQQPIATLLRHMAEVSGNHLVLVGGSGGGFAALDHAQRLGPSASALVWNPQTDVLEYSPRLVKSYLEVAFPVLAGRLGGGDWKALATERMTANGMEPDLAPAFAGGFRMRRLLWLQNWNDWHTRQHMVPLVNAVPGTRELWPGVVGSDDEHVVWLTESGEGHAPPPADAVQTLLARMLRTDATCLAVTAWEAGRELFPRQNADRYVRDLRAVRDGVRSAVDLVFAEGRRITPRSAELDPQYGGLRFRYDLVGPSGTVTTKFGGLGSTFVVPEAAAWDHVLVRALDGFDHQLFEARFLNQEA